MQGAWSRCFQGYRGEAMHYLGYELPRIPIPRNRVNRARRRGEGLYDSPLPTLPGAYLTLQLLGFGSSIRSPSSVVLVGMMNAT